MAKRNGITNLKKVNADFKKYVDAYEGDMGKAIKTVSFSLLSFLQTFTPRDTGRAINGWNVNINKPPSAWKPKAGLSSYTALTFPGDPINFDSFVNISNNVEYIVALNEGHSMQRPGGFMDPVLMNTRFVIQREFNKLNRKKYAF